MAKMNPHTRIRVLSIDDHPLLREGIAAIINSQADMQLIGQAASATDGIRQYRDLRPDVTLLDLRLPDISGIDALIALRTEFVEARIIILSTSHGDFEIQRALEAGARGFLLKSMPPGDIVAGIRQVHAGRKCVPPQVAAELAEYLAEDTLTEREVEVLRLIANGNRNRDIATALSITEDTVKSHVKHLLDKLSASDRTEAVVIATRRGIISL
jgi:DNA-binding NarL/FixJ family response regulator